MKKALNAEVEKFFRPEFINRLDETIVFQPLVKTYLNQIIEFELAKVRERLAVKDIELELDDEAKSFIIEKGYNPDFGARPLRRALSQLIEDPLAEGLLAGEFNSNQRVNVTHKADDDHLYFSAEAITKESSEDDSAENEPEATTA